VNELNGRFFPLPGSPPYPGFSGLPSAIAFIRLRTVPSSHVMPDEGQIQQIMLVRHGAKRQDGRHTVRSSARAPPAQRLADTCFAVVAVAVAVAERAQTTTRRHDGKGRSERARSGQEAEGARGQGQEPAQGESQCSMLECRVPRNIFQQMLLLAMI